MNRDALIESNNLEVNHLVAKCLRVASLFLVTIWLFAMTGYYQCDKATITLIIIACMLLALVPTVLVEFLHFEKQWIKYYAILCVLMVVYLLSTFLSSSYSVLVILTLIIATLYCDRRLIIYTAAIDCIFLIGTVLIRYNFLRQWEISEIKGNLLLIVYSVFLRIVLVLVIALFSDYIVGRNMIMLTKSFDANEDLIHNQEELIYAFAEISESKSKVTGDHIHRVAEYMRVLGTASGFTKEYVDKLALASMMHDIGKLMIPEEILDKPDKLTKEEYAIMKSHVLYGEALLTKCPGDIMKIAKTIALQHHERWDGSGYLGMKGEEIAYISRLMALCDVFDALTSNRYYKEGWSIENTYNEIIRLSGTHFDPDVVQLFVNHFDEFKRILIEIPDKEIY